MPSPYKLLQIVLAVDGVAFWLVYPVALVWPSGWAWHEGPLYADPYLLMILSVYAVLGIFLIRASRRPEDHLSLIWFVVWSSLVHGTVMGVLSFGDSGMGHMDHHGHLVGDVPGMLLVGVVLAVLVRKAGLRSPAATS